MTWTSSLPILIWALTALPLFFLAWKKLPNDKFTAILVWLNIALYNLFWYWTVNWAFFYYYLRIVPILIIVLLAIRYLLELRGVVWISKSASRSWIVPSMLVLSLAIQGFISFRIVRSFYYEGEHVLAMFPLRTGLYVVANGGNGVDGTGMNNYVKPWTPTTFGPEPSLGYAADVFEMRIGGILGKRNGILPTSRFDYEIFNEIVYCPCVGEVVALEDGHPDVDRGQSVSGFGNYLVVKCSDTFITLANLKNGSILVKPGDSVGWRYIVAAVGNSGAPGIPHLHIHATSGSYAEGEGTAVPIVFDGMLSLNNFLTRNKIVLR